MKRVAAPLLALLCACDPELHTPHAWACSYSAAKKDSACTGGWYCARDNFCHDPSVGEAVPCQKTTVADDCASGWFCGLDSVCHDSDAGVQLLCEDDTDCGGGWHCGVHGQCYDLGTAGAVECRADAGDCAATWRCGVDDVCHPDVDAGAIACRYGVDSDCTDGWRCGSQGRCVDPAGEQLVLGATTTEAPLLVDFGTSTTMPLFVGPLHPDGNQSIAIGANGMVGQWHKATFVSQAVTFSPVEPPVPVPGIAGDRPLVVDQGVGFGFAASGMPARWFLDGGTASVAVLNVGHPVDSLRLLPLGPSSPGEAAFLGDGGVFLTQDAGQWVPFAGGLLVDVQGLPQKLDAQPVCWLAAQSIGGTTLWKLYRGSAPMCSAWPTTSAPVLPGDVRVGADGLVANVRRLPGGVDAGVAALEVYDFSPATGTCGQSGLPPTGYCWSDSLSCRNLCNASEELVDFNPVHTPSGLGAEVACLNTGIGGPPRWLLVAQSPVQSGACTISDLREVSLAVEGQLQPLASMPLTFPIVAPGGLNRFAVRPGDTFDIYGGTGLSLALPWFMDRPTTLAANAPFAFLIGEGALYGLLDPKYALSRPASGMAHIIGRVPHSPLLLSTDRLILEIAPGVGAVPVGVVDALDTDWVEPLTSTLAPRAQGSPLIAVGARDSLYAAPLPSDGGVTEIPSVLSPAPGSDILGLSPGLDPLDAGLQASLWVGTRDNVLHAWQTLPGRWHAQVLPIELPDTLVDVWTTPDGRGRVGVANGQMLSVPSGLLLAPSPVELTGQAQRFLELCQVPFLMDERYVYALRNEGQGPQWKVVLDGWPRFLKGGGLFDGSLFNFDGTVTSPTLAVFGRYGDVWLIKLDGCGP
jgi:hypothetical protein